MGFLKGAGIGRLALIFGVTAGVAAALFFLMSRSGGEPGSLLYAGLTPEDAAQVAQQLDQGGIRYEIAGDGGTIMVARDQVAQARILVASEGALSSGTIGYEIFDRSDALGSTQFVQDVNARRAQEGELARTIASIHGVTSARVHLVLPERRLFERDAAEPTATVIIGLADPALAASLARTIRNLVATATSGLSPSRVTVVDEDGRTLANGAGDEETVGADALDDRRATTEERLRAKVLDALLPIVGENSARVQVAAEIDLTRISTTNETYDPDSQVARSTTTVEDTSSSIDGDGAAVSVSANLPEEETTGAAGGGQPTSEASRTEETINYEISRSTVTEVREAGEVLRLSVAVAVDQARVTAEDGTVSWRDRTPEELAQIEAVARAAVGYNEARGDVIEVTSLPFERPQLTLGEAAAAGMFSFDKNDILRFAEIGVMLIVGLALTLLVARPLAQGLSQPAPMLALAGGGAAAAAGPGQGALPAGKKAKQLPPPADAGADAALPAPQQQYEDEEATINIDALDGKLKASTVRRVSEVVEAHPEESMAILRTWMHER